MSKLYDRLEPALVSFIRAQRMFFVGTAPLAAEGHVNLSPKGHDTLAVLDERTLAYLDLTGSAAETVAHLKENGRIVLMWCAFEGPPKILRVHGRGTPYFPGDGEYDRLALHLPALPGARAIVRIDATRVADSCGFAVPEYRYEKDREQLVRWAERKGADGLAEYQAAKNATSIDGLPALPLPGRDEP